ncbi:MAG TPA: GAF domain-containing protein [Anaerolineaceae bacterium]|nr:GAF domain-containing protein [Anaerolineaceae bacterium]
MNFWRSLDPRTPPANLRPANELAILRERILQTILLFISLAALVGCAILAVTSILTGNWGNLALFILLTTATVLVAFYRSVPYKIRAAAIVALIYFSGIYGYISAGLTGDGKLYMLAFTILTAILLGLVPGIIALIVSVVSTGVFGYAMVHSLIPIPPPNWIANSSNGAEWLISIIFLAILGTITTISLAVLINSIQSSLQKQKSLTRDLQNERSNLELKISQSTRDIERRVMQIKTASDIARSISSLQDPQILLQQVVDQIREKFELYYVGVFLVDEHQYAVLKAGTGEAGTKMILAGHRLQVGGSSMIGWCIANRAPRIALDVGKEAVRFNNPNLPETRSELALPILSRNVALGALTIQSREPAAFDDNDIRMLEGIADSLAIAIENAGLFLSIQANLDEIRSLNRAYLMQGWNDAISIHGDFRYTFDENPKNSSEANNLIQVPMTLRDQVIGQIMLETNQTTLAPDDLEFVEAITVQTALALENARLINETQRKAFQEETVNKLSGEFSRGMNIEEILTSAVKAIGQLPAISEVSVYIGSPGASDLENDGHKLEAAS